MIYVLRYRICIFTFKDRVHFILTEGLKILDSKTYSFQDHLFGCNPKLCTILTDKQEPEYLRNGYSRNVR